MTRIRLILLSLLAVLAVSAVSSASASAAFCTDTEEPKTIPMYCIPGADGDAGFGVTEATGETVSSKGGLFELEVVGGPSIECKKEKDTGTVWNSPDSTAPGGKSAKLKITFTECVVKGNSKCTVQDSVKKLAGTIEVGGTEGLRDELKAVGGVIYDVIKPSAGAGTVFVTLEVKNKGTEECLVKGTYKVTGESCAEASDTLLIQAPLHFTKAIEQACGAAEKLKLGGKEAFLIGLSEQEMTGAKKGIEWAVVLT